MRKKVQVPQWIPTAMLVLLVPVIGYLAISNIEDVQHRQDAGAQADADAGMIMYMSEHYNGQYPGSGYQWKIERRNGSDNLLCYCDAKGYGWWYDVQVTADGVKATKVADTSGGSASTR